MKMNWWHDEPIYMEDRSWFHARAETLQQGQCPFPMQQLP